VSNDDFICFAVFFCRFLFVDSTGVDVSGGSWPYGVHLCNKLARGPAFISCIRYFIRPGFVITGKLGTFTKNFLCMNCVQKIEKISPEQMKLFCNG